MQRCGPPASERITAIPATSHPAGSRTRALASTFVYAVLSQRLFLVDEPDMLKHFESPAGVDIAWSTFADVFQTPQGTPGVPIRQSPECDALRGAAGRDGAHFVDPLPNTLLEHRNSSYALYHCFWATSKPAFEALFGTSDRMQVMGLVMKHFLFSRPSRLFLAAIESQRQQFGLGAHCMHVAVQFRSWVDDEAAQRALGHVADVWDCMHRAVLAELPRLRRECEAAAAPRGIALLFATDNWRFSSYAQALADDMNMALLENRAAIEHTSQYALDPANALRINSAMVDWWMLGDARLLVSIKTTYTLSSRARTDWAGKWIMLPFKWKKGFRFTCDMTNETSADW